MFVIIKKQLKRTVSVLICIAIIISVFGCTAAEAYDGKQAVSDFTSKEYIDDKEFLFIADLPPQIVGEQLDVYAAAGFNGYILIPWASYNAEFTQSNQAQFIDALELLKNKGLGAMVRGFANVENSMSMYLDGGLDLTSYSNFKGFYVTDEPSAAAFDYIAEHFVTYWNQNYAASGAAWHLNLYPSYAPNSALGTQYDSVNQRSAYQVYIEEYAEKVLSKVEGKKYMCMDHYPLNTSGDKRVMSSMFLYDLAVSAKGARIANASFGTCIQAYSNPGEGRRQFTSSNESKFLFNVAAAMGSELFEIFCYESFISGAEYTAMIGNGYNDMYYYVQEAITELKKYDHVLMEFDFEGFKTFDGELEKFPESGFDIVENMELAELSGLSVTNTHDLLVGQFADGDSKGYMAVNYTDPFYMKPNKVKFTFSGNKKAVVYRNGNPIKYSLPKNTLELTLMPGEAVFVIPA